MIRLATVFSGIGSIEHALNRMNVEHNIVFACDNGERELKKSKDEIDEMIIGLSIDEQKKLIDDLYLSTGKENFVQKSYMANYDLLESDFYQDIRFLDGNKYANQVDLFVGGMP